MSDCGCLDDLISCLWRTLREESQETGLLPCTEECLDCLAHLVGPGHYYTQFFKDFVTNSDPVKLLGAVGVLSAAREEAAKHGPVQACPMTHEQRSET